ncbi:TonB-dependent receptor plug domain-containing protein [Sphingomonas glacialis]|uniref:TonB-dependent receptor-like protein n=1 Tax=Sphingomonas glacialis TaxID=658225 RepID=A0A502FF48_9SPHN|nr:TonB-dependent receptor [Sphingomonas glacialis]TPG48045.1 TonB-dependent receptor-like protein [Sphingomonas glacialis]
MSCFNRRCSTTLAIATALLLTAAPAIAADPVHEYHIRAQALGPALREAGRVVGRDVMFPADAVAGRMSPALDGTFDTATAMQWLLSGTDLQAVEEAGAILIRGRSDAGGAPISSDPPSTKDIIVTGSRIRGGQRTSPVTVVTERRARDAGQSSLGEVVRALPQSFGGGQNPGVAGGGVQGGDNENVSSASTINLRGLGSDATLTLINGHRIAYNGANQSVDVSQIPLGALDRIEVVADGASAVYGSDAVGGVANIILKPDYDGLTGSAQFGGSTDGGNVQQRYDLVGGARWSGGGFMLAGEVGHVSSVYADERSYTRSLDRTTTLMPSISQQNVVLTAHQDFGAGVRASIDANYSHRTSRTQFPSTTVGAYDVNGSLSRPHDSAFSISPRIEVDVAHRWNLYLTGTYSEDRVRGESDAFSGGQRYLAATFGYANTLGSVELGAEGPLLRLPAGDVRLAIGGGYRSNGLTTRLGSLANGVETLSTNSHATRDSRYGFAELSIPVVSPDLDVPGIHRLTLNGAIRYEDYASIARLATPKLGFVYAPSDDLDIKASWGRSFKSPTLYQQFQAQTALLLGAQIFANGPYPASATTLLLTGGRPILAPEHATTWSGTLDLHPRALPGADLQITYFHIAYRDRIIEPFVSLAGILGNSTYASLISYAPTPAQLQAIITATPGGLRNYTSGTYDPAQVVAIVDDRVRNAEAQTLKGVDIAGSYRFDLRDGQKLIATGLASYLESNQTLLAGQPSTRLAGAIFRPPHWRARTGLSWETSRMTLSGFTNYVGPVRDTRYTPAPLVNDMTTLDLTVRYHIGGQAKSGLDVTVSALNVFNAKPAIIRNTGAYEPTYDSTNYSVVGRFLSLTLSKTL